eukprot:1077659_1
MSLSWANTCQLTNIKRTIKRLDVVYSPVTKQTILKSPKLDDIPLSVRYEKELASDDDMILTNGNNSDNAEQQTVPFQLISDAECVLNHFNAAQIGLFLQFIVEYLPLTHAINLMKCCTKYTTSFGHVEDALLIVYKQLYHRDFGAIKFKYNKKSNTNRSEQKEKFRFKLGKHSFWESQYEYKTSPNYKCPHWYIAGYANTITILCKEYESTDIRDIGVNDLIIVTKHRCNQYNVLDIANFKRSNWYKVVKRHRRGYHYLPANDTEHQYYGYKNLRVRTITNNMSIQYNYRWSRLLPIRFDVGYVFPMRYIEREFYLKSMKPMDAEDKECAKYKRNCVLKPNETDAMVDETEVEGIVFDQIVNINELEMEMRAKWMRNKTYLRVAVYIIGLRTDSWNEAEEFGNTKIKQSTSLCVFPDLIHYDTLRYCN